MSGWRQIKSEGGWEEGWEVRGIREEVMFWGWGVGGGGDG